MEANTVPHKLLMEDNGLQVADLPASAQSAVRRFDEKFKTYTSTKTRMEKKGEEWDNKQKFLDDLGELDDDAANKISRFLEERENKINPELAKRAKALGLPEDASEAKILEEEKKLSESEASKKAATEAEAARKAAEAADGKLSTNEKALKKLHDAGKTTVSLADLKGAGFDTGFFGPIGVNGCKEGNYLLYRDSQYESSFQLTKS